MDDDNDEPVPENDDEPSSDESSDDGTITKAVRKPSKNTITVRLEPHQPKKSKFPTILSGGQCRSFQSSWYSKWSWLEWDDEMECAFFHPCRMATNLSFITFSKKAEKTFSTGEFQNWKDATSIFRKHDSSHAHKEAVMKWAHYTKSQSIAAQLAQQFRDDQTKAQTCLLKIISSLQYIAHQGLPSRGHDDAEGNFLQLLNLRSKDCSYLKEWILQRQNWTSHDTQNELFEIMAHTVLRKITENVRANKYSIIVDEATNVSFKAFVFVMYQLILTYTKTF